MLNKGSTAPDIEELGTEADGQEGFIQIMGVLDEELVHVLSGRIGGSALGNGLLAVFVRVDVGTAAGEKDTLAGIDEIGSPLVERD